MTTADGSADLAARAEGLAERLPESLRPLARVAYNYRWSWTARRRRPLPRHQPAPLGALGREPGALPRRPLAVHAGARGERSVDPRPRVWRSRRRWTPISRDRRGRDRGSRGRSRSSAPSSASTRRCRSTRAGSACSPATSSRRRATRRCRSSRVGLFYRRGYFRQRLDLNGRQQEYWIRERSEEPADGARDRCRRQAADGCPSTSSAARPHFQVWRVDVGRVPLYLLDTELPANGATRRWTAARLYEGNRAIRLAQYALLGMGGDPDCCRRWASSRPSTT